MILVSMIVITSEDGSIITDPLDLCLERLGFEVHKTSFGIMLALSNSHTSKQVSEALGKLADTYRGKYRYHCDFRQYNEHINDKKEREKSLTTWSVPEDAFSRSKEEAEYKMNAIAEGIENHRQMFDHPELEETRSPGEQILDYRERKERLDLKKSKRLITK